MSSALKVLDAVFVTTATKASENPGGSSNKADT